MLMDLLRVVILGCASLFGIMENDVKDNPRVVCPLGDGGNGPKEPTCQLHKCLEEKVIQGTMISSSE
jgi:hypothetical protein